MNFGSLYFARSLARGKFTVVKLAVKLFCFDLIRYLINDVTVFYLVCNLKLCT